MSLGVSLHESEEKKEKPAGFFPQLYENVCKRLSNEDFDQLQKIKDDPAAFIKWVCRRLNKRFTIVINLVWYWLSVKLLILFKQQDNFTTKQYTIVNNNYCSTMTSYL